MGLRRKSMLELVTGYLKLNAMMEQYQNAEKALAEAVVQQEALFRMPGEFSREVEQAKSNTNKAIKLSKASRDAYAKAITQLTGNTPENLYSLLPGLVASLEALQKYQTNAAELRAEFEILAMSDSFDEEFSRADFEAKLAHIDRMHNSSVAIAKEKYNACVNGKDIVVVNEAQLNSLLTT